MEEAAMTPTFWSVFPYLLVIIIDFYILPLLIRDTGSAMIMLLIILPFICFASSVFYGIRHSFHLSYAFIVAILFLPSLFIYYNISAWIYSLIYGIIALAGNLTGYLLRKTQDPHERRGLWGQINGVCGDWLLFCAWLTALPAAMSGTACRGSSGWPLLAARPYWLWQLYRQPRWPDVWSWILSGEGGSQGIQRGYLKK